MTSSRLINRNVTSLRGRTSMRLEPELWDALEELCRRERLALGEVVKMVEKRGHPGGRTSAVRVFILDYFRVAATEAGHVAAAHKSLTEPQHATADPRGRPDLRDMRAWLNGHSERDAAASI